MKGAIFKISGILQDALVSIRAPREGCDPPAINYVVIPYKFQSAHPVKGAIEGEDIMGGTRIVSIRAPREGCDSD